MKRLLLALPLLLAACNDPAPRVPTNQTSNEVVTNECKQSDLGPGEVCP